MESRNKNPILIQIQFNCLTKPIIKTMNPILAFQQECYTKYLDDIRQRVPEIPTPYLFPDGNPVLPVLPVETVQNGIMIIGAFPSARFERRNGYLIPIGNNLSPFGTEKYFDGQQIREQASRVALEKDYFTPLNIASDQIWLTDLVKVYLFPEKHIKNCNLIYSDKQFVNTHKLFEKIAKASLNWIEKEIELCNPTLIITLGEVSARVISSDDKTDSKILLDGCIRKLNLIRKEFLVAHLAHPEIRRLNKNWDILTSNAIAKLSVEMAKIKK